MGLLCAALLLALALPAAARAGAGDFDPTFSGNGVAFTGFDSGGTGRSLLWVGVAEKPSGKAMVAGGTPGFTADSADFGLAQFRRNGRLDSSFGDQGTVRIDFGGLDLADGAAVVGGRILLVGSTADADTLNTQLAIARLLPSGELDPSFGSGGKKILQLNGPPPAEVFPSSFAVRRDGKIVVAGHASANSMFEGPGFVARLLPNGDPDPDFGSEGMKKVSLPGFNSTVITDLALDRRGRIALSANNFPEGRIGVARLTPSGDYDHSFSGDGRKRFLRGRYAQIYGAATTPRGAIVVAGNALRHRRHAAPLVARLDPRGRLDHSFGGDGTVVTTLHTKGLNDGYAWGTALQSHGRVLLACQLTTFSKPRERRAAAARLTRRGRLDRRFGRHGKRVVRGINAIFTSVVVQSNDQILLGGGTLSTPLLSDKAIVARLKG